MDNKNPRTEAADIMALGSALSDPIAPTRPELDGQGRPFVVVPDGYKVRDLEHLFPEPMRNRGVTEVGDMQSFITLVNDLGGDETRLYFGSPETVSGVMTTTFGAVLNDAQRDQPNWADWRIVYPVKHSPEWRIWSEASGKQMVHADFAAFIENNLIDIVTPAPADMLEISRTLEAKKAVNFASALRLDNGQIQIQYEETVQGSAAKGRLAVPDEFEIGIPVYVGGQRYAVRCRLRYRISDRGTLTLWFEIIRPHKILEDAQRQMRTDIEAGTGHTVFVGAPASIPLA